MGTIKTVNEESLVALGDAIRSKTGGTDPLVFPTGMVDAINSIESGGGSVEVEPMVLTGTLQYVCSGPISGQYIEMFGDTISTQDITGLPQAFSKNTAEKIPFEINMKSGTAASMKAAFQNCANLKELPKINNAQPKVMDSIFKGCNNLREIPDDYFDDWDWTTMAAGGTASSDGYCNNMFDSCYSLRKMPLWFLAHMPTNKKYTFSYFYGGFNNCYALDELVDLPIPYTTAAWTNNAFSNTFVKCYRLKNMTFETPNGQPVVVKWKSQTIDLSDSVGSCFTVWSAPEITTKYNSGITEDKRVYDDATYQALKNDPDWFTDYNRYSRYNHDSAVATINSLPDTSAYLASAGGTNTIKFMSTMGGNTDGGEISTLTEEEIAVAAAKGWTVSLVS